MKIFRICSIKYCNPAVIVINDLALADIQTDPDAELLLLVIQEAAYD